MKSCDDPILRIFAKILKIETPNRANWILAEIEKNVLEPQFSLKTLRSVYKHHDGNKYFKRKINQNPEFIIF